MPLHHTLDYFDYPDDDAIPPVRPITSLNQFPLPEEIAPTTFRPIATNTFRPPPPPVNQINPHFNHPYTSRFLNTGFARYPQRAFSSNYPISTKRKLQKKPHNDPFKKNNHYMSSRPNEYRSKSYYPTYKIGYHRYNTPYINERNNRFTRKAKCTDGKACPDLIAASNQHSFSSK